MCQLFRPQLCYRLFVSKSAFLGFEVEHCSSHLTLTTLTFFYVIGYCYTFIFASELGLRLIANTCTCSYMQAFGTCCVGTIWTSSVLPCPSWKWPLHLTGCLAAGRYRGQCSQSCVLRRHSRRVKRNGVLICWPGKLGPGVT